MVFLSVLLNIENFFLFSVFDIKIFVVSFCSDSIRFDLKVSIFSEISFFLISIKINKVNIGKIIKNNFFSSMYSLMIISSFFDFKLMTNKQKDKINR